MADTAPIRTVRPPEPDLVPPPGPRSRRVAIILAAGAVGALALPLGRVGIGWLLTGLAVASAAWSVRLAARPVGARERGSGPADRWFRAAMGAVAVALLAVAGVRAAGWLVALCVVTAAGVGSYALVGGARWVELLRAAVELPAEAVRASLATIGGARPAPYRSVADRSAGAYPRWRAAVGVLLGVALLVVFGALFRAADPAFARLLTTWAGAMSVVEIVRAACALALVTAVTLGTTNLLLRGTSPAREPARAERAPANADWVEWAVPLLMLDVLFGVFAYIQLDIVFRGHTFVLGPGGPTYASFARTGFAQLLVVTLLTLGVFAALARWAGRGSRGRRALLRVLGGALGVFTLLIVASAVRRMGIYAEAYGFTRARLLADAAEVWLGLVFVTILVAGVRLRATWLPRAVLAAGVAVLLGLVALNPDAYVARTVIGRYHHDGHLDAVYLSTLSADALPQINTLPEIDRECILALVARDLIERDPWYGWNAGREVARASLRERPLAWLPPDALPYPRPADFPRSPVAPELPKICWP